MASKPSTELPTTKTYLKATAALMVLLVLTVGASFVHLGPFNVAVALGISLLKALLIILIFMEVRYSHPIVWLFAGAAFLWFLILVTLTLSDYFTRQWSGPDWKAGTGPSNHVELAPPSR